MKRTKPTKKEKEILKPPHGEFPGYMPHPPSECSVKREIAYNNIEYVSNTVCAHCKKKCQRRKEFENEWKEFWRVYKQITDKYRGNDMVDNSDMDSSD